jgi:hypothetical protein
MYDRSRLVYKAVLVTGYFLIKVLTLEDTLLSTRKSLVLLFNIIIAIIDHLLSVLLLYRPNYIIHVK